ncbi:MAG: protein kinase domain-containing protein [Pyrinomonadaceae bacterium]
MTIPSGTILGRYEIRSKIGAGGMGEVYLGVDTALDRMVAIKILPGSLASEHNRLQRFTQEAKAASALNHPHILTIYEIGSAGDARFLATEFIDGETLRQRINAGIKLSDILEFSTQITSALAAAHAAGIIHRDIKPENIMVRRDGYVKVLDFGLAKLTEPPGSATDTEAPTKAMINTGAGTVMGTANYMSPEQAKGIHVDTRTDLWSIGAVLYEMITGHLPFSGETPTETISLILQKAPLPLTRYTRDVPAELERIVTKALTKDRDDRYQTAKDLLIDLRNLKRKQEVDAEIDRTVPPEFRAATSTASGHNAAATISGAAPAATAASAQHSASSAEYIVSSIRHHKTAAAIALVLLVGGALILGMYLFSRKTEAAIRSIAVLPFENRNHDANTEYMSDGLTDSIINSLTQLPNLKVIARSSVFRYKGKQTDPLRVAKELGVQAILTGRILQRGDNLTISTELIDARDNKQIWGEQYERRLSDLLSVQREIAQQITGNLRLKLSPADQGQMARQDTDDAEAYQLYLKGRYHWNKRSRDGLSKSVEFFNQAIEHDPNYALAYAGLADSWFTMGWYQQVPIDEGYTRAKAAVTKALAIDPQLSEAHMTLATIKASYEWDWPGAESEFKLALQLNPRYPTAHHRYSLFLPIVGRLDEAVAEAKKAQELDPLSLIINENVGDVLQLARRYDEAEQQLLKTIELDPNFAVAHATLARVYEAKGMQDKWFQEELVGVPPEDAPRLKKVFAESGMKGIWRDNIEYLLAGADRRDRNQFWIAALYAQLGEKDRAFEWLNKAFERRNIKFTYLVADQRFDSLRSDPRYDALLQRAGLHK